MPTPTGLQVDILPPPTGMATADDLAIIGEAQCQYARGFLPARHGKTSLAPILKAPLTQPGIGDIHGCAIWKSPGDSAHDPYDWLVLAHNNKLYATRIYQVFNLDERADGPHSYFQPGSFSNVTLPIAANDANVFNFVQFKGELISSADGFLHRFYVDSVGNLKAYALGLPPAAAPALSINFISFTDLVGTQANTASPKVSSASYTFLATDVGKVVNVTAGVNWIVGAYTIASVTAGVATLVGACASVAGPTGGSYYVSGNLSYNSTYQYLCTWGDEFHRESSPSSAASITTGTNSGTGANDRVTLTRPTTSTIVTNGGAAYWNVYRRNPGSTTFNLVAEVPYATTTYLDTNSDATVQANTQTAPSAGENDPPLNVNGASFGPGLAYAMEVWNDCLVLDYGQSETWQVSNIGSPTQFSSLPLPVNLTDGVQFTLVDPTGGWVSGFASLGDRLAVFTTSSTWILYGQDSATYQVRKVGTTGCINAKSIQKTPNGVLFLGYNGLHFLGGDFSVDGGSNVTYSNSVEDMFTGWIPTADVTDPASLGRLQPAQMQNSIWGAVNSFYIDRRYFLAFGDETLVFDLENGGCTDTGYGFVKTACVYASGMVGFGFQCPEAVFLTVADQYLYSQRLQYWTMADTPEDVDSHVPSSSITTRPLAPVGQRNVIVKKAGLLGVYGSTFAPPGSKLGTVTWFVDGMNVGAGDVFRVSTKRRKCLFELTPPAIDGEYLWAQLDFELNDLVLGSMVWEWVPTG